MKFFFLIAAFILKLSSLCFSQDPSEKKLDELSKELSLGDKNIIPQVANYLDSDRVVNTWEVETTLGNEADQILRHHTLFTKVELSDSAYYHSELFLKFYRENQGKIFFDTLTKTFLITPSEERQIAFQLSDANTFLIHDLKVKMDSLLKFEEHHYIASIASSKDTEALKRIAVLFFRDRYEGYNAHFYMELLTTLTHQEVRVEDENGILHNPRFKFQYGDDCLNYFIYWIQHYRDYQWDEQLHYYRNIIGNSTPASHTEELFQLLSSKNDSVALDAFTQLSVDDPDKVIPLANDYEDDFCNRRALPIFPFSFLKQMVMLTKYCRENGIAYSPSEKLLPQLAPLLKRVNFDIHYNIENELIKNLSADQITEVEYFGLLHNELSWDVTYSVGRIIDKFYSQHWNEIINDDKQLLLYLKKTTLYERLGIIGSCNNFIVKFVNSSSNTNEKLKKLLITVGDSDIHKAITKVLNGGAVREKQKLKKKDLAFIVKDYSVHDLDSQMLRIISSVKSQDDKQKELEELVSKINYRQIGTAIHYLQQIPFKYEWFKYSFVYGDFGIPVPNLMDTDNRNEFMRKYDSLDEYHLYQYYINKLGITFQLADGSLDYNRIYDILKFDVVEAFVGGGLTREQGVYAIIKLLELHFKTTLNFPLKLCNSMNVFRCSSDDRAKSWMQYLEKKNLVTIDKSEPPSFLTY